MNNLPFAKTWEMVELSGWLVAGLCCSDLDLDVGSVTDVVPFTPSLSATTPLTSPFTLAEPPSLTTDFDCLVAFSAFLLAGLRDSNLPCWSESFMLIVGPTVFRFICESLPAEATPRLATAAHG
ncbi:hypothetical protein AX774_g2519 [Zancudomyces culisetae]|uniref:Uncharacterized protein n=1 Tax=Zancudomyces culisetae TaxID=1213189 RepID=A0A1R1PSW0_ZANCU|nr:hypothetical protein AX774_g2519 [Zancudomyces culisetae]|eukprot:OMH83972.1 hypothetical protein AX774_g2519 [Zancudomyces culisetae]